MGDEVKIVDPTEFQVQLVDCGTDTSHGTREIDRDPSALCLAERTLVSVVRDFIGRKPENLNQFMYDIAVMTLGRVLRDDFDEEDVIEDIRKMQDGKHREELHGLWSIGDSAESEKGGSTE